MLVSLFVCMVFNGTSAEKAFSVKNRLKNVGRKFSYVYDSASGFNIRIWPGQHAYNNAVNKTRVSAHKRSWTTLSLLVYEWNVKWPQASRISNSLQINMQLLCSCANWMWNYTQRSAATVHRVDLHTRVLIHALDADILEQ